MNDLDYHIFRIVGHYSGKRVGVRKDALEHSLPPVFVSFKEDLGRTLLQIWVPQVLNPWTWFIQAGQAEMGELFTPPWLFRKQLSIFINCGIAKAFNGNGLLFLGFLNLNEVFNFWVIYCTVAFEGYGWVWSLLFKIIMCDASNYYAGVVLARATIKNCIWPTTYAKLWLTLEWITPHAELAEVFP